jgi:type I restriction enzyme S subunit
LDPEKCLPEFLHAAFLQHPAVLQQLGVQAKGAVMPGLNMGIIEALSISLPPMDLQRDFARSVDALRKTTETLRNAEAGTIELFSSLQHRAFSGAL